MVLSYNAFLRGTTSGAGNEYAQVLVRLLRMRQATNHPALVTKASIESDQEALDPGAAAPGNNDEPKAKSTAKTAGDSSTPSCLICREPIPSGEHCKSCAAEIAKYSHLQSSTKIKRTMQLLEKIRKEPKKVDENGKSIPKKTIIFSQVSSLSLLLIWYSLTDRSVPDPVHFNVRSSREVPRRWRFRFRQMSVLLR